MTYEEVNDEISNVYREGLLISDSIILQDKRKEYTIRYSGHRLEQASDGTKFIQILAEITNRPEPKPRKKRDSKISNATKATKASKNEKS